jgi:hypothetical protein
VRPAASPDGPTARVPTLLVPRALVRRLLALTPHALTLHALTLHALTLHALTLHALTPHALTPHAQRARVLTPVGRAEADPTAREARVVAKADPISFALAIGRQRPAASRRAAQRRRLRIRR